MLQIPRSNSALQTLSNVKFLFDFYKTDENTQIPKTSIYYEKLMRLKS